MKNILTIFLLLLASTAMSQPAKEFLQESLVAYGPWSTLQNYYYSTARKSINPWQSFSYTKAKAAHHKWESYMDFTNGKFHNHSVFTYPGGYVFDFVTIGKDSTRWFYDKNNMRNGKALVKQGKEAYLSNQNGSFQPLAYYVVKLLAESKDELQYNTSGNEVTIKRIQQNGNTTDFVFDEQTKLLKKTHRTTGGKTFETLYNRYKIYNGLQVATHTIQLTDGVLNTEEKFKTFSVNQSLSDALFIVPPEYKEPEPVKAKPLEATAIAKDVYLVERVAGDRNVVFINMNDYIIITEAPISSDVTKAVLDVVHKTIPGKPVKYVHLSHHHNDHTSGIRQMVAEGTTILCTPPIEAPMRAILNGALGTSADDYSKAPKEPQFELIHGIKVLEDKDHRVEFHSVKNSHADGLSFLYLPKEEIIYEGDLLSIPEDGTITPAIAATKEFNKYLKKNNINYSRMIGHHSHSFITHAMFNQMFTAKKKEQQN